MKVYICSSLREKPYAHVTRVIQRERRLRRFRSLVSLSKATCNNLPLTVLRPGLGGEEDKLAHVVQDVGMIREADELWVMGEYGRDCSWEIGFAMALGKPVRIFVDDTNRHLLEQDWMILYGNAIYEEH